MAKRMTVTDQEKAFVKATRELVQLHARRRTIEADLAECNQQIAALTQKLQELAPGQPEAPKG